MRERRRARRRRKGKMPPVHGCIVFGCPICTPEQVGRQKHREYVAVHGCIVFGCPICTSAAGATDQAGGGG